MKKHEPRIAVVGAGANGAANAADLARAGRDLTVIEQWPENVAALRERGIDVRMPSESFVVPVRAFNFCDVATLRETFDIVLIMVKAYDTKWATWLIEPLLAPDGVAVGVQNGMTLDDIAGVVGIERTVGCVIEQGSAMFDPGIVLRATPPSKAWYAVGATDPRNEHCVDRVVDVLRHSGTVEVVPDIRAAKWMKLVVNTA
jgi:2-dehydropantoate 2-reductase